MTILTFSFSYDEEGLKDESAHVKAYLAWVFARGLDDEVLSGLTEILLGLAREAPASVSLKATDLIVNLQSSQQSFFKMCTKVFVVVKDETAVRWNEIRLIGQRLFQLIHNSIMDESCAKEVLEKVKDVKSLLLNEDCKVETDYQQLCFKEGIVDLLLSILKHDLDDDQLDNAGQRTEPTVSQEMLIKVLSLLSDLATNYAPVQEILLYEMVSLLSCKNCLGPLVAANLVNALIPAFKNPKFQAKVREVHVVALVQRMLALYDNSFFVAEFLDLLFIIAWSHAGVTETSVVHQNQSTIITQLMKSGNIGADMLEETHRISSWTGFDEEDNARLFGDFAEGGKTIKLKGKGFDESLPGIVVGDKDTEKHELLTIERATLEDGVIELELTTPLKYAYKDGTSITKPSTKNVEKGIITTAVLSEGDSTIQITRKKSMFELKDIPVGVDLIIGEGAGKELSTVKAVRIVQPERYGFAAAESSMDDEDTFEVEFDSPVEKEHPRGSSIIVVGTPTVKKGTLESIKLEKQYVISLVELLAICGAGKNRYIEAICKKIIPIETDQDDHIGGGLIDVITKKILSKKFANGLLEEHVELPRFKAYMKYLYHIYLSENCIDQLELRFPLITNPDTWEILKQCEGEVVAFSNDVGNKNDVDEIVFANRLALLFDVCGLYLLAIFTSHYTEEKLDVADELQKQREAVTSEKGNDQLFETVLTREECEEKFMKIAPGLIEGLTRTIVQGRHQTWWTKEHNDMLTKLLQRILENAVRHSSKGNALNTLAQDLISKELATESVYTHESTKDRTILSVEDWKDAGELSEMLAHNTAFNRFIILTRRAKDHKHKHQWCLREVRLYVTHTTFRTLVIDFVPTFFFFQVRSGNTVNLHFPSFISCCESTFLYLCYTKGDDGLV